MSNDKIVEEVRNNREKIFSEFDYDMKKYSIYILEAQKEDKRKIVNLKLTKKQV